MKSIVISEAALNTACHPDFPAEEVLHEDPPSRFANVLIRSGGTCTVVSESSCPVSSRWLVIGSDALSRLDQLRAEDYSTFFERSVRFGLRSFDKNISLSPNAMPYREGGRSSAFASQNSTLRVLAEEGYQGSGNVYVYDLKEAAEAHDLSRQDPNPEPYANAIAELESLLAEPVEVTAQPSNLIDLDWQAAGSVAKGFAFEEWLPLLSDDQRKFVEKEVVGPMRVRGAAGTGKTLAMVLKAIKLAKDGGEDPARILFLTHSWAIAGQIDEMIRSIGRDIPAASLIEVYPLMEIARQRDYARAGRRPLGLDSESGKRDALKVISGILDRFVPGDWIAYRGGCSQPLVAKIEAAPLSRERRNLEWDLLIEFGCVMAADGLLGRASDLERYLRIRRVGYMMHLDNSTEKEVVFQLWRTFLAYLRDEGFIATDQIISDYLNELQTFYWEARRGKEGYDYVFVDEMHLFNAQERLIFHNLLADGNVTPKVIMALDPKQSPREVFAEISDERDQRNRSIYERAHLPNPDKIDFVDVYRYTEEIAQLTRSVLDRVPALDMSEDWDLTGGSSLSGHGPLPQYRIVADLNETFAAAVSTAKSLQAEARREGGQVAILCMDYDRFARLYPAARGQNPKDIYVIASRDDVERLRFMKQRIVFSTPEYVAGLQFDTVVLVDANADLTPDGPFRGNAERRFLSELYLGISRAERRLIILASRDSGGLTPHLSSQADAGLMEAAG